MGCSAWFDMLTSILFEDDLGRDREGGLYGMSSCSPDCLSVEKGVLISRTGV